MRQSMTCVYLDIVVHVVSGLMHQTAKRKNRAEQTIIRNGAD